MAGGGWHGHTIDITTVPAVVPAVTYYYVVQHGRPCSVPLPTIMTPCDHGRQYVASFNYDLLQDLTIVSPNYDFNNGLMGDN